MLQIILNLLSLKALSTPIEVYIGLGVVWLMLLGAGIASVFSRPWPLWVIFFWVVFLVLAPVIGMTFYCLVSLCLADYSFLKLLGLSRRHTGYLTAKPSSPQGKRLP